MGYFRDSVERMAGYTPGFQPRQMEVVKLNTNENPYPVSPKAMEAIHQTTAEHLRRYPDPQGQCFQQAAAEVLGVGTDNILCTNGGDDLLNVCVRACCDAQRPLAYAQPTYSLYPVLAQLQVCPAIEIDRTQPDMLDQLAKANAALTIVCNPNAPTCDLLPVDALAALASKLSGVLLIDEAYVDFADENALWLTLHFDNVILLRSMSKGYSLAGLRFGFGIANANLIEGFRKVRDSYPVDAIALRAAAAAMADQDYFQENVQKIKAERMRLTQALRGMGMDVPDSQTNFVLAQCRQKQAETVFKALMDKAIYVRYFKLPGLEDKLRITVGTPEQNDKLLAALKTIL